MHFIKILVCACALAGSAQAETWQDRVAEDFRTRMWGANATTEVTFSDCRMKVVTMFERECETAGQIAGQYIDLHFWEIAEIGMISPDYGTALRIRFAIEKPPMFNVWTTRLLYGHEAAFELYRKHYDRNLARSGLLSRKGVRTCGGLRRASKDGTIQILFDRRPEALTELTSAVMACDK